MLSMECGPASRVIDGKKDNHLFPAGKIAMTLFSFFARKSPRELSLPFHMS